MPVSAALLADALAMVLVAFAPVCGDLPMADDG
jgi:hypothetical protein